MCAIPFLPFVTVLAVFLRTRAVVSRLLLRCSPQSMQCGRFDLSGSAIYSSATERRFRDSASAEHAPAVPKESRRYYCSLLF